MTDNFLFGKIFVKASKPLAIITFIVGILLSLVVVFQWKSQHQETSYQNNPELISSLTILLRDYGQTKNKVMQLHSQLITSTEEDIKLYLDPEVYEDYTEVEHFEDLKKQLQSIDKNSVIFKELVFENFSNSVNFLLGKMREYAILKKWINEVPQIENSKVVGNNDDFYLIASPAEIYEKNIQLLKESIDYLNNLKKSVENPSSKVNINTMLNHLAQYQNIMRKVNVSLVDTSDDVSEEDSGNKKRIFIIMDELELIKKKIQEVATANWTVDASFKASMLLVEKESNKCLEAKAELSRLNFENAFRLVVTLVLTLSLSVGILISSDVFNALFQIASKDTKSGG